MKRAVWLILLVACKIPDENFTKAPGDGGGDDAPDGGVVEACATPGFPGPPLLPTATTPIDVVAADVSGDGLSDLVVATGTGFVSVLIATGSGAYRARDDYPIGVFTLPTNAARKLQLADVDKDTDLDIVVANRPTGSTSDVISILKNDGAGAFAPKVDVPVTQSSPSVAVQQMVIADVTGDGNLDIVTSVSNNSQLPVLVGSANGTFTRQGPSAGSGQGALAVGDIDGDQEPDILVAVSSTVKTFRGGSTSFTAGTTIPASILVHALELVDLDGDTLLDLVMIDSLGRLDVNFLSNGGGTFSSLDSFSINADVVRSLEVVDLDGDGLSELVGGADDASSGQGVVFIIRANATVDEFTTGQVDLARVEIGKLDDNTSFDIVSTSTSDNTVTVMLDNGGTFATPVHYQAGVSPQGVAIADVDGDGKLDVAVASNSDVVHLLRNNGDGTLRDDRPPAFGVGAVPAALAVADVSGDGRPDLVTVNQNSNTASVLIGEASVQMPFRAAASYATGASPRALALAFVDGDTQLDMLVANTSSTTFSLLRGFGDGFFEAKIDTATTTPPFAIATGDFNKDTKLDVIVGNSSGGVEVFIGDGSGAFPVKNTVGFGMTVGLATGDLDADGDLDVIAAAQSDGLVRYTNEGGAFQASALGVTLPGPATAVTIADLDGDGDLDVVATINVGQVSVLLNANGTFAVTSFPSGRNPVAVAVADVNLDGKLDIVTASSSASTASVLLGDGQGAFASALVFATGATPSAIAVADVDLDGRPDLVTADAAGNSASVLRGSCLP